MLKVKEVKEVKGNVKNVNVKNVNEEAKKKALIAKKEKALIAKKEKEVNEAFNAYDDEALLKAINEGNLNEVMNSFKNERKQGNKQSNIYKDVIYNNLNDKERKSLRSKLRRLRNNFAKDIASLHDAKDVKGRNLMIKKFIAFYKSFYKVNDYSFLSLSAKNNDKDTYEFISLMLKIIKESKVKG